MQAKRVHLPAVAVLLCIVASLTSGCTQAEPSPPSAPPTPILLVGIDGLEWEVMVPLLVEGRLPHLRGLMEQGVFGLLDTTVPTSSPIIWTSVVTGLVGDGHGIQGFTRIGPDGGKALFTSRDRKAKALWNILTDNGMRANIIGWWNTYPVEEINGLMVAQANTVEEIEVNRLLKGSLHEGLAGQVYPPEWQAAVLSRIPGIDDELPEMERRIFGDALDSLKGISLRLWNKCHWSFRADALYREIALEVLDQEQSLAELTAVYLGGTDVVAHRFWRYHRPDQFEDRPTDEEIAAFGGMIPAYYEEADRVLGELLARAGSANVIVLSDHGMRPVRKDKEFRPSLPVRLLRSGGHPGAPPGVLIARGPDIRNTGPELVLEAIRGERIGSLGSILDITPTVLALLQLPVGRDMDGEVLGSVIASAHLQAHPVEWVETHTPPGWAPSPAEPVDPTVDEKRLEQLRSLGYIE